MSAVRDATVAVDAVRGSLRGGIIGRWKDSLADGPGRVRLEPFVAMRRDGSIVDLL